jgi:hypothetical protein
MALHTDLDRSTMAQFLTASLPFGRQGVTRLLMVILAAAALATFPSPPRASAVAQATATIRVISAVRLKLDGSTNDGVPPARDSLIKTSDGSTQPAKLIEFQ